MPAVILSFICAIALAGVAAWFSITGLMAIFAGLPIAVAIMAGVMEVTKLVAASILYRNWKVLSIALRSYLSVAIVVLMLITSLGIYGYLSKAHLDQGAPVTNNIARIERIEQKIEKQQYIISEAENKLSQLDGIIATLIEYDKISGPQGAKAVKIDQTPERELLDSQIVDAQNTIDTLIDQKFEYEQTVRDFETEVGPIKYIAALIYDDPDAHYESAVRVIILMLIFVFDPLAVLLLIAANNVQMHLKDDEDGDEPTPPPSKEPLPTQREILTEPEVLDLSVEEFPELPEDTLKIIEQNTVIAAPGPSLEPVSLFEPEINVEPPVEQEPEQVDLTGLDEFSAVMELRNARSTILTAIVRNLEERNKQRPLTAAELERKNLILNILRQRANNVPGNYNPFADVYKNDNRIK